jgi:hypothetical protein
MSPLYVGQPTENPKTDATTPPVLLHHHHITRQTTNLGFAIFHAYVVTSAQWL